MAEKAKAILNKQWSQSLWTFSLVLMSVINILLSIFSAISTIRVDPDIQTIALWILLMLVLLLLSFSLFFIRLMIYPKWYLSFNWSFCLNSYLSFSLYLVLWRWWSCPWCSELVWRQFKKLLGGDKTTPRLDDMPTMEMPYLEYYRKGIKCLVGQKKHGTRRYSESSSEAIV